MRDKKYFNEKLFVFTNDKLKKLAKKYVNSNQLPLYLVVDKALREFLEKEGYQLDEKPRVPKFE